jgi:hypothetical protein
MAGSSNRAAKKQQLFGMDLLDGVISDIQSLGERADLDVIEFTNQVLEVSLFHTQAAVLKAFYGLDLEPAEEAWLQQMVAEDKSTWVKGRAYKELSLECGMRGTKTFVASIIVCYEIWKLMQLDDPATHFNLAKNSPIFIITVATTQQQSNDTVYGYTKARMEGSTYFQNLMNAKRLTVNESRIEFPEKRLTIIGGHSNQAGMVGKTSKLFVMDEAARFQESGGEDAKSMYSNVGRSTVSFKDKGFKVVVSSAWSEGDIMEWLYDKANPHRPGQKLLAFRLATWDLNPNLTKEDLRDQYDADEVAARRDHEGIRPGTVENFFTKKAILNCVKEGRPSAITYNKTTRTVGDRTYVEVALDKIETVEYPVYSYAHCDPAIKRDSFTFACARPVKTPDGIVVYVDAVLEWEPKDLGRGVIYPVHYQNVEDVILQVHKARNIRRLTFDHFNNTALLQSLYTKGIVTREANFSRAHQMDIYTAARRKFNAGMVVLPDDCPKLVRELIHIQLKNGVKIDHPKKNPDETTGSKDLADSVISCIAMCIEEERTLNMGGKPYAPIQTLGRTHVVDAAPDYGRVNIPRIRHET